MGNCISNKKNENIVKDYFTIINEILLEKNRTNFNLIDNLKICLNEKNFDQVTNNPVQYFTYEEQNVPTNFINWLDFIYQYLSQEYSHERYWAMEMIDNLNSEKFESESKYLSEFFLEEFEIEYEPKCIQIEKIKKDIKLNLGESVLNVTQNLGGSFTGNAQSNIEEADIATLKYNEYRNKVKKYIFKFKQHILNRGHPINRVVQIFEKIWVDYAQKKTNLMKQNYNDFDDKTNIQNINKQVNELTFQLQRFVVHLQIGLKLFYSRTINYSCFNEEKDELINLITTLVFRTGEIYNTIFELYKLSLMPEINNMTNCLLTLIKIQPEELGIFKQFCLNKQSLDYQEEILLNKLKSIKNNSENNINNNEANKKIKNSSNSINNNFNFKVKENEMEENKINLILKLVKENKKRCPKSGDREIEETKVNLEFEENFNLISAQENIKEKKLQHNISNALFPINEIESESDENIIRQSTTIQNFHMDRKKIKLINPINENNIDDNSNYINDTIDEDLINKNIITRTILNNENENNLTNAKIEKVFNKVSFLRTKNSEFLAYPYETAIQLLKQIKKYKTPFEKMMIIASISSEITECINDFWRNLNDYIKNDLLNLEIDQLMSIFIYIIIKSQIFDISVHCKIIKSFTTCITKASMIGYYYSTVEASVSYIQSIKNVKELVKNKIT